MQKHIMEKNDIERIISRMALEILERTDDSSPLVFIGIKNRGDILADRLAKKIESVDGRAVESSAIDITFYRDDVDLKAYKYIFKKDIQFEVNEKNVVLVDDVIFTGRSVRAALDAIVDSGRAKSIQLAVLIDRGGREFPIQPDYFGKKIQADLDSDVQVMFNETDNEDKVIITWE